MNFTHVLGLLQEASIYDLYRLKVALQNEMENPAKIFEVRQHFTEGDQICYFNAVTNTLAQARVLEKKQKYVLVQDLKDHQTWKVPYYMINLSGKSSDIDPQHREKLTRNHLKVGEFAGFKYDGKQYIGVIEKLNLKTVQLKTRTNHCYRVPYGLLFKVIEGQGFDSESHSPALLDFMKNLIS
jgi:hypothetical protein